MKYCSKQSVSSGRTLHYIKLFEDFDKDYIKNSINDLLIELQDMGMLVEVWHWKPTVKSNDINHKEYYSVSIKGVLDEVIDFGAFGETEVFKTFNTNLIVDYVGTVIDFMAEFCPGFEPYFEYYGNSEKDLGESKTLLKNKKVAQLVLTFTKRK